MKLTSLFLGDIADLFQDSAISDAKEEARMAAQVASSVGTNGLRHLRNLADTVEARIQELEAENAVLGLILLRTLQSMAEKDPALVEKIVDDVRNQLNGPQEIKNTNFLRKALNLPEAEKTPIHDYAKPTAKNKRPAQRGADYYYPPPKTKS